jgi:dihydrofolate synthase/folylpolyglutamate synthase
LERLLARLAALHPRAIDLSLARIERLLAALGNPHERVPPAIHVAGTDGKGSTLAFCAAVLEASGRTVHSYTSPHLVRFNERIRIRGREIADTSLLTLLERVEATNAGAPITFFEVTTAAAFLAFSQTAADFLLLETGLGGRLDATNVIARPAVTGITPIDYDHQRFLGRTLAAIAAEKAGILKRGVPAVIAAQRPAAMKVIAQRASALGTRLSCENIDWRVVRLRAGFRFDSAALRIDLPMPALVGEHQLHNAGTALALLSSITGLELPARAIRAGIARAAWPARLQRLRRGPLSAMLGSGWELWLDGAHNPHGARALAAWLAARGRKAHLIAAMIEGKNSAGFFAELRDQLASVTAVPIPPGHAGIAPDELARTAARTGLEVRVAADPSSAIAGLLERHVRPGLIVIAGSLYLAGAVLSENS